VTATVDDIFDLFRAYGDHDYLGEPISLSEHMLQTAHAAELDGAPPPIVAAALLHDIGHLLHELPHDSADHGIDTIHEQVGARWLATRFSPDVSEPVRLHVAAKRYLCATDAAYFSILSPASVLSLNLQGGPFTSAEAAAFAANAHGDAAVRLRRWDDVGKLANHRTPTLDHFRSTLVALAR
jgi:[1-hydroxy-2-(trimethylamino)ethyl]phosphonate dioxygenase